jgi:Skp family chaperone for outer membrane proteins
MKLFKIAQATVALLFLAVAASAQQQQSVTQAGAPQLLPKGKIAVINTAVFQQQVGEFRAKLEALNRQFEPRVKEVQTLADRITSLETTMKTQSNVLTPAKAAEMTEQLERMKREHQRKVEDLQADGGRARDQALQPINEKLSKFAQNYTARRGIVLLIDVANAINSNTVTWYDPRSDITQDFITEYNKANPVAQPAAPAPATPQPAQKKP